MRKKKMSEKIEKNSQSLSMQPDKLKKILDWKIHDERFLNIPDANGGFFGDRQKIMDPLLLNNMKNTIDFDGTHRGNKGGREKNNEKVSRRYQSLDLQKTFADSYQNHHN